MIGSRQNSIAVTTPKFPPPPRSAQNSSASSSAVARRSSPSGVTISIAVTAFDGQAVLAGEPADAASQRVADDADVMGGAGQRGEPVLGRRTDDLAPGDAGADPGDALRRIDGDVAHALGLDQQAVAERAVGGGVVAGALDADPQARLAGERDGGLDVGGIGRDGDRGGMLVDGEVPGEASLVPAGVGGPEDVPGERRRRAGSGRGRDGQGWRWGSSGGSFAVGSCLRTSSCDPGTP